MAMKTTYKTKLYARLNLRLAGVANTINLTLQPDTRGRLKTPNIGHCSADIAYYLYTGSNHIPCSHFNDPDPYPIVDSYLQGIIQTHLPYVSLEQIRYLFYYYLIYKPENVCNYHNFHRAISLDYRGLTEECTNLTNLLPQGS